MFCFTNISALHTQCHKLIWGEVLESRLLTPLGKVAEEKYLAFSLLWVLHVIPSGGMCKCVKWLAGIAKQLMAPEYKVEHWLLYYSNVLNLFSCEHFAWILFLEPQSHRDYHRDSLAWVKYLSLLHTHTQTHTLFMRWNGNLIFRKLLVELLTHALEMSRNTSFMNMNLT